MNPDSYAADAALRLRREVDSIYHVSTQLAWYNESLIQRYIRLQFMQQLAVEIYKSTSASGLLRKQSLLRCPFCQPSEAWGKKAKICDFLA
jgi:hypothetical protein